MKRRTSVLLIIVIAVLGISAFYPTVLAEPDINATFGTSVVIDGVIGTEWDDAGPWAVTDMGINHSIRAKHDGTYLYILEVVVDNDTEVGPFDPYDIHDWAGVEFDLNGDNIIHGNATYPDDWEFCNYKISGGEDWLTKGFGGGARDPDTIWGGTNDVTAAKGFNNTHTIWEFRKKLNSGDTNGYDIALDPSQTGIYGKDRIYIALAYQEGKTGKHYGCSHFYLLVLAPTQYTLTINSSPTGVTFTVDGVPQTAPWSETYNEGTSVNLIMPQTHGAYEWSQWQEDLDTNRIKAVTMDSDITLTGVFTPPRPVGGNAIPIDKMTIMPGFQIPWAWLSIIVISIVATVVFMTLKKRKQ
jgi:hypothetical protein